MKTKILVVDDEEKIRRIVSRVLSDEGYEVKTVDNGKKAIIATETFMPELIIMDQNMPELNGIEAMVKIKEKYPQVTVIIITAFGEISLAVEAIKKGGYDYLEKPFDNDKLLLLVKRALEHRKLTNEVSNLRKSIEKKYSFDSIIGNSEKIRNVIEQVKCVCETDATVLIHGESGVGKDLVAQAIHYNSNRKNMPYIAINCGAIPNNLIESELFGFEKGAFTDAKETKPGKFEQASTGTIFLDEIRELSLEAQVKFLRVLEENKIMRLGGKKYIPVDVRIISATNKNLEQVVQEGAFRLDLFYRLNIFTIYIPPIRERKEDIPLLIEYFIKNYNKALKLNIQNVSETAIQALCNYNWPGNVRDLQNAIQSAMILVKKGVITEDHLPIRIKGYASNTDINLKIESGLDTNIKRLNAGAEKELIMEALQKCNYNRTETSKLLKISRKTLFNKMKQYGIG